MDASDIPLPTTRMDELVYMFDNPLLYLIYQLPERSESASASDDLDMLCLRSFLNASRRIGPAARVLFLESGRTSAERMRMMKESGRVVPVDGTSRGAGRRTALRIARSFPADTLVYFATADHVYHEFAFERLLDTFALLPEVDYVTLDGNGSDRSTTFPCPSAEWSMGRSIPSRRLREVDPFVPDLAGRPFSEFESTGSEFGVRGARLRRDCWIHYLWSMVPGEWSEEIWTVIREVARMRGERPLPALAGPCLPLAVRLEPVMRAGCDPCGMNGVMPGIG